jgi:hypothetical protein
LTDRAIMMAKEGSMMVIMMMTTTMMMMMVVVVMGGHWSLFVNPIAQPIRPPCPPRPHTHTHTHTPEPSPTQQTLFPNEGAACVTRVFEQAYHDIAPLALRGDTAKNGAPTAQPPSPPPPQGSKIPAPIGRIPAAASLRSGWGAGGGADEGGAIRAGAGRGQLRRGGSGGGPSIPLTPSPATGLAELLVEELGMMPWAKQHGGGSGK